ncbi:putative zinc-binding metallopeptidase [Lysinibacillus louembei]|uniref:Zinc-binding metallopeptidase n=1 Tax=Lysinibacillus louembei TaxID=1470088 RepID=A0ABZ0RXC5_9BACI|nr:putative zinc-binding metallopeptidase [Lysinibacillus louembei]WPK12894.1 putative zinc-binding metallopeptidase [Lysinibacillus louembei]
MRVLKLTFWVCSLFFIIAGCSELSEETETEMIIETNAMVEEVTNSSCLAGEIYIAEEDTCALPMECNDYNSCVARGDELVYLLEEEYGSLTVEEAIATDLEGTHDLFIYEIDNEKEMIFTEDDVTDEEMDYHAELWFDFAWLIPEPEREGINQFIVFESGDTLAYVNQHDDSGQYWTLGMNKENIELASETMITYIHEYAHYLSLKDGEQNIWVELNACEDVLIEEEGCFYEDAYLTDFYQQFWNPASEYEDDYVSGYASSSVVEDFAESFAHFVLTPQPTELDTLAAEKIAFFYEYEYFVELRAQILTRAATWLVRAVE